MRRKLLLVLLSLGGATSACGKGPDPNDPMGPTGTMPDNMRVVAVPASSDSSVALP